MIDDEIRAGKKQWPKTDIQRFCDYVDETRFTLNGEKTYDWSTEEIRRAVTNPAGFTLLGTRCRFQD